MPKRKFAECAGEDRVSGDGHSLGGESEDSNCSSVQTDGSTDVATTPSPSQGSFTHVRKKKKKNVSFDGVTVYYFPRKQGFTCVPSQGGSTLGMSEKHHVMERFSLSEYALIQRRLHHEILLDQHQQGKIILPPDKLQLLGTLPSPEASPSSSGSAAAVLSEEDEEDELSIDDYYFLQPVPTRQRRVLLRQSGIKKIEAVEKDECKDIRSSREVCGCSCKVFCDPDTCICSQAGIKCQVDRLSFPCGCSKDGCGNLHGRIEFNPIRVRTHFLHTLMRLELEKKHERSGFLMKSSCDSSKGGANKANSKATACQVRPSPKTEAGSSSQCSDPTTTTTSLKPTKSATDAKEASPNGGCPGDNSTQSSSDSQQPCVALSQTPKEEVDLSMFNSNEKGSCRDCQKSDISEIIMRESQFGTPSVELDSCMATSTRSFPLTGSEETGVGLPTVNNPGESLPQLMMFSDDDEAYNADNAGAMFQFPKEESSYSESSDCSSEGAGSVDEQPAYRNYQNYPASHYEEDQARSKSEPGKQQQQPLCEYPPGNAQKYMNLTNSTNGYKLEPISEILNPIRYAGYQAPTANNTAATSHQPAAQQAPANSTTWGPEQQFCAYRKQTKLPNGQGDAQSSEMLDPYNSTPARMTGTNGLGGDDPYLYQTRDNGVVNGTAYKSPPTFNSDSSPQHDTQNKSNASGTSNGHQPNADPDQPKYHELKSSSQPSVAKSTLSYFSANQVPASFDQNTPASVPPFHLSSGHSTSTTPETGSPELFGLPRAQTAQPVATFDLPNTTEEVSSEDRPEPTQTSNHCPSPATEQVGTTQNFGEIIKESIVETVSA